MKNLLLVLYLLSFGSSFAQSSADYHEDYSADLIEEVTEDDIVEPSCRDNYFLARNRCILKYQPSKLTIKQAFIMRPSCPEGYAFGNNLCYKVEEESFVDNRPDCHYSTWNEACVPGE